MGTGTVGERVSTLEEQVTQLKLESDKMSRLIESQLKDHQALTTHLKMIFAALAASSVFGEPGKAVLKILSGGM